ncbi:PREDICTED: growth-regulating factor 1-like [Nicotiana attenuata]|uniref:Growth-regulating factor n=1 Tax=Nicotiana attenuata TaxID=49451 RepID=A0A314KTU6_NICAT|nr:PREDICTED: growth-regulating factor 1-like [Nicotiana attenuata]OIT32768.1 growth-regulating factor 5 [Nicotiana attenuata]
MMSTTARNRFPFTANQWQELEHQALIYKYMVSGMPVPPDLLYTIRRSLDSSLSSKLILHQPHHIGWNCFQMGFGKKIDPEPGRCRRTDGKKWRCSKEAYPDSKYCERHMHRGRNRSRKPVEIMTTTSTNTSTTTRPISTIATTNTTTPTAISISSINKNTNNISSSSPNSSHHSFSYLTSNHEPHQYPFLYPHSSSSRPSPAAIGLESSPYSRNGYSDGMKEDVDEHIFFSETSGTVRSTCGSNSVDDTWQLSPLTMGSSMKQRTNSLSQNTGHSASSYLQLQSLNESSTKDHHHQYYNDVKGMKLETEDHQQQQQPKKVMHHFFDEWPKDNKDSWLDSEDKYSGLSKTQLSISIPNPSYDFFITTNEK